jgi:hypothetical protein
MARVDRFEHLCKRSHGSDRTARFPTSPRGRRTVRLTFYRVTPEGARIFIADADGSGVRQVT